MFSLGSVSLSLHSPNPVHFAGPHLPNVFKLVHIEIPRPVQTCSLHLSTSGRGPPTEHPSCLIVDLCLTYVSLRLRVQNEVPAQPCVGKLGISLVLLNFLHCNFRLWFKTP